MDLKILMYQNADEIEKLKKIKEDSDREADSPAAQDLIGVMRLDAPRTRGAERSQGCRPGGS